MDLKKKKILITGGTGFVGSFVHRNLIERGVLETNIFAPNAQEFDLRDWAVCRRVVKEKDIVIHLAAVTGGIEFHRENQGLIFYENAVMGMQLMEAARQAGAEKFVTIGSATEYPEPPQIPLKEENLWDGYPGKIHAPYSFAKKMLLVQGDSYRSQYGFNVIHLLPTNMFGPGERIDSDFVIPSLTRRFIDAKKNMSSFVEIWGTGKVTRDFLYVEDAAEGIVCATEKYDKPDPVNLGSGKEISIKELANMIAQLIGFSGEIRWDTSKPEGQLRRLMDTSRAKREFGFSARISFKEALQKTVEWHSK